MRANNQKYSDYGDFEFIGKNSPLIILTSYLVFGYVLFLVAPFNWVLTNTFYLTFYFCAVLAVFIIGFKLSLDAKTISAQSVNSRLVILLGTFAALILIIPTTLLYSGKYPWQFMELLADQTDAYTSYVDRVLNSSSADRAPVALVRTIFHPLVFAVLPLAILNWSKLKLLHKSSAVVVLACLFITSLARGTDKENADFVIVVLACLLVNYFRRRNGLGASAFVSRKLSKGKLTMIVGFLLILFVAFFYVFVERKLGRYGGEFTRVCVGSDQDICLTNSAINMAWLGDWGIFALGITSSYMSAGYYGLSLALGLDFHSTWGTGCSPMIARVYEAISGDSAMYVHSYTYRLRALGWSDEYVWSTLMIWFANDVGFLGALIVLFFLSMLFGASWRDAVLARDDRAAIVFVLLFIMFIYLPANNQIGQSQDMSLAFLFWLFRWQFLKVRKSPKLNYVRTRQ